MANKKDYWVWTLKDIIIKKPEKKQENIRVDNEDYVGKIDNKRRYKTLRELLNAL